MGPGEIQTEFYDQEPILDEIYRARRRAATAASYLDRASAIAGIFEGVPSIGDSARRERGWDPASTALNNLSTFLYVVSYYVVAPTSCLYSSFLGMPESYSGVLIGAAPVAGLLSAVLYSWWANRSFKRPLIFCSMCCLVGSFLYAMAYSFNSFSMVMAGRLLTGFGGARAVNRRYIADNVPLADRTRVSAEFVAASALGMAAGPGLSALLSFLPDWSAGFIFFNQMTSPGWLSFVFWGLFLALLVRFFKEPERAPPESDLNEPLVTSRTPTTDATDEEMQALMESPSVTRSWWRELRHRPGVIHLLWVYFIIKYACELLVASSSVLARFYFGWSEESTGVYLAFLGLCMIPANHLLSVVALSFEDSCFLVVPLLGVATTFLKTVTTVQYFIAGLILFVSSNIVESVSMSILSKVMPRSLAKGTFNSGLLSSESGMLRRALGDVAVTGSSVFGMRHLAEVAFLPVALACFITTALTFQFHRFLQDPDIDASTDEEEDTETSGSESTKKSK